MKRLFRLFCPFLTLLNYYLYDDWFNEEDINELEDNSDENRTEEKEEFVNQTDDSNNQVLEESNVEASKDNLDISSDEDKVPD